MAVGRSGLQYFYVCPPELEQEFISSYQKGRRLYQLQKDDLALAKRIRHLLSEMKKLDESSQRIPDIKTEINALKSKKMWLNERLPL
jgi:hypothetical protein